MYLTPSFLVTFRIPNVPSDLNEIDQAWVDFYHNPLYHPMIRNMIAGFVIGFSHFFTFHSFACLKNVSVIYYSRNVHFIRFE